MDVKRSIALITQLLNSMSPRLWSVIYNKHSQLKDTGKWNILSREQIVTIDRYTLVNSHTKKCHYIDFIMMSTGSNP